MTERVATRLRGISAPRPRRRRDPSAEYPRRGRGVAAIHQRKIRAAKRLLRRAALAEAERGPSWLDGLEDLSYQRRRDRLGERELFYSRHGRRAEDYGVDACHRRLERGFVGDVAHYELVVGGADSLEGLDGLRGPREADRSERAARLELRKDQSSSSAARTCY